MLHSILVTTLTVQCTEMPSKIDLFKDLILNKARLCDLLDVGQPSSQEKRKPQSGMSSSSPPFVLLIAAPRPQRVSPYSSPGRIVSSVHSRTAQNWLQGLFVVLYSVHLFSLSVPLPGIPLCN
ncbi:hypothetical protein L210DRAFT_989039 [Boletus edulis BED1]|uniref:Uncharacterized protein n=1 Tax=Boletus edulis BED1 TaxID=1328754 RepID=A0AAD4GD52_BOLED|nr:hypothetical protein L210DRAFT_989039 [Boletus edulis BED1]